MGKLYKSNQQDISNYDIHIYKHGIFKNPLMCYITVNFTKLLPKSQTGFLNKAFDGIISIQGPMDLNDYSLLPNSLVFIQNRYSSFLRITTE